jgi:CTP synthase
MERSKNVTDKGGQCVLELGNVIDKTDSLALKLTVIDYSERHRHRYEYNSEYVDVLQKQD